MNLGEIKIFKGIKKTTLKLLEENYKEITYKKGEFIFFEKDNVEDIYLILSGRVTIHKYTQKEKKKIMYILGDGEFINEVIFDNLPASINAEAFEKSVIIKYSAQKFKEIMAQDFDLAYRLIQSSGRKVRRLYRQLKNSVPISLDKKVASKLWKLSKDYGIEHKDLKKSSNCEESNNIGKWTSLNFKISITYLADMLGSSRESISRELKKIEQLGLIKWENKKICIKREEIRQFYRK